MYILFSVTLFSVFNTICAFISSFSHVGVYGTENVPQFVQTTQTN